MGAPDCIPLLYPAMAVRSREASEGGDTIYPADAEVCKAHDSQAAMEGPEERSTLVAVFHSAFPRYRSRGQPVSKGDADPSLGSEAPLRARQNCQSGHERKNEGGNDTAECLARHGRPAVLSKHHLVIGKCHPGGRTGAPVP